MLLSHRDIKTELTSTLNNRNALLAAALINMHIEHRKSSVHRTHRITLAVPNVTKGKADHV